MELGSVQSPGCAGHSESTTALSVAAPWIAWYAAATSGASGFGSAAYAVSSCCRASAQALIARRQNGSPLDAHACLSIWKQGGEFQPEDSRQKGPFAQRAPEVSKSWEALQVRPPCWWKSVLHDVVSWPGGVTISLAYSKLPPGVEGVRVGSF